MLDAVVSLGPVLAQFYLPNLVWWAIIFFGIALLAYLLGANGVAGLSAATGRVLLFVFLVLAVILAAIGFVNRV